MREAPDGRAIVLTFDNLGEATALQRGTWDPRTPLGSDPSVTRALPWLLDALDHSALPAPSRRGCSCSTTGAGATSRT